MDIDIPRELIEHEAPFLKAMFGIDPKYTYHNDRISKSLFDLDSEKLNKVITVFSKYPHIRGTKTALRDIDLWISIATKGKTKTARARKVSQGVDILQTLLLPYPRHHVYKIGHVGEETAPLACYVEKISYHPRYKDSPEYVQIDLIYSLFGAAVEDQVVLYYSDILGRTGEQMLARKGLYLETPELREAYESHLEKFAGLQNQIGKELKAWGYGDTEGVDSADDEDGRSYFRWTKKWDMGTPDSPSSVVVDVFQESDERSTRRRPVHVSESFWHTRFKWINGTAEIDGEIDESIDDIDRQIEVPIHPYLICFDLAKHRRLRVHVANVEEAEYDTTMKQRLSLPRSHISLIDTLLAQSGKKFKDIIINKSGGTIILLQGAPGLGKTMTAEVFAHSRKSALYSVQCAQLGINVRDIEKNLIKILRRGERWGIPILLDECDVFVRHRGDDIEQNAIVGAFLRVLEYYSGVLFLTTNRGETIDDAILSRCTARLTYEMPSRARQIKIWKSLRNANRAKISDEDIAEIVRHHNLSGRDIKNLLKLCIALSRDLNARINYKLVRYARKFRPTHEDIHR